MQHEVSQAEPNWAKSSLWVDNLQLLGKRSGFSGKGICEPRARTGGGGVGKERVYANKARNVFPGKTPQNACPPTKQ